MRWRRKELEEREKRGEGRRREERRTEERRWRLFPAAPDVDTH